MVLLLLAGLNVWIFHSRVYPKVAGWDSSAAAMLSPERLRQQSSRQYVQVESCQPPFLIY
jgi:hypothetical protein